jgi:ankyrin repeat protein
MENNNSIPFKFQHLNNKLFFKITNTEENHNGFQYVDGLNILDKEFEEEGSCVPGGLYFTDVEHIFEFLDYGIHLREIILPFNDPNFKCVKDEANKWRANMIILGKKYDLCSVDTFKYLISLGADFKADNNHAIEWASENGHLEIVKYLVGLGANFRAGNNYAIRFASENGHLEVVKFLVDIGADFRANNNYAVKSASENNYLEVVKYLIGIGSDFRAENNYAVRSASEYGHLDVVKFLVGCGADFKADNNFAVRSASENGHLDLVKYLVELGSTASRVSELPGEVERRSLSNFSSSTCPVGDKVRLGADFRANNNYAVKWAFINGHSEVVKYLLECGAILN